MRDEADILVLGERHPVGPQRVARDVLVRMQSTVVQREHQRPAEPRAAPLGEVCQLGELLSGILAFRVRRDGVRDHPGADVHEQPIRERSFVGKVVVELADAYAGRLRQLTHPDRAKALLGEDLEQGL
jgi:hypothetical protein